MPHQRSSIALALGLALASLSVGGTVEAQGRKRLRRHPRAAPPATSSAAATLSSSLAVAAAPVPPQTTRSSARAPSTPGRVQFVTDKRAYLDRGAADGLTPGQALPLARGGRSAGSCTVDTTSDHGATCVGGRPRVGDTFRPTRILAKKVQRRAAALAPVVDEETLVARAAIVSDGAIDKVDFSGKPAFRSHSTAEITPGFSVWFTRPDAQGGSYAQERIDGTIRGVALGFGGLHFDGAFSAMRWSAPAGQERFRAETPTQFYLWEAEVTRRVEEGGTVVAVGRLWPFHTPGLTLLDGVQLGRQNQDHTLEGGFYGGLIPTAASLTPNFDILTAGIYGARSQAGNKKSRLRFARQEARLGVWRGTTEGVVAEAEALAQAWVGPVVAGGGGRLRWATRDNGPPAIENAHLDLGVRPSLDSAAGLHVRYVGATTLLPDAPLRGEMPMTGAAVHALADARVDLSPRFGLAGNIGAHREGETGRHQAHGSIEARWPRLFGRGGGIWCGASVEQGWMQGENVYAQFVGRHSARVQVLARLSAGATRFDSGSGIWNLHEAVGSVSLDGAITSWLRVRAWSMLRAPILEQGAPPAAASVGGAAGLSIAGAI